MGGNVFLFLKGGRKMRLAQGGIILYMLVYNNARGGWERRAFLISFSCLMLVKSKSTHLKPKQPMFHTVLTSTT